MPQPMSALSSCHMLWFLSIAAKRGFCVDRYFDAAVGEMHREAHEAHEDCFIANSVRTEVRCEPRYVD